MNSKINPIDKQGHLLAPAAIEIAINKYSTVNLTIEVNVLLFITYIVYIIRLFVRKWFYYFIILFIINFNKKL